MNEVFFATKSILAMVGALLLVTHMNTEWRNTESLGRRLRYIALALFGFGLSGTSFDKLVDHDRVEFPHMINMLCAVVLVVASIVSIRESHRSDRPDG